MGGVGVGSPDGGTWLLNPALLGFSGETTLSLTLKPEHIQHKDSVAEAQSFSFGLSSLRFALPLPREVVVGVSVQKRFDLEFDIIGVTGIIDTIGYKRSIAGRGGIYSTSVCLGRKMGDQVALGGGFSFFSGSGVEEWTTEFTSPEIRTSLDSLKQDFSGGNSSIGILTKIGGAFTLGFSFTTPTHLKGDLQTLTYGGAESEPRSYTLPATYSGGMAYAANNRLLIASDLTVYPWNDLSVDDQPRTGFVNTYRFALGAQLLPARDELAPLWKKIPVRAGYTNFPWYFEAKGGRIDEHFLTLGSSLSLASGAIDVCFEVGERKGGSLTERVLRGGITLSGWEKW